MQFTCAEHQRITSGHSNVTSKNVSSYHFSWATLYKPQFLYLFYNFIEINNDKVCYSFVEDVAYYSDSNNHLHNDILFVGRDYSIQKL